MKQIIPFKKDLLFKTKISEVTSISLEHSFKVDDDIISGNFHIAGDYKMTEGSIRREEFEFDLPFDIALDSRYKEDSLIVDIDNFYYQIINNDTLQIHIDLYVDGEKIIEVTEDNSIRFEDLVEEEKNNETPPEEEIKEEHIAENIEEQRINTEKEDNNIVNTNINISKDFNIFDNVDDSETYETYYVYIVKEDDTIDYILEKYNITKEELGLYNDLENIKPGEKIIIPSKNE